MKKNLILLGCAWFLCSISAQSQVSVARYKGDSKAAISYTFDDGLLEQYTELFPQLKKYGIKASFCVNGNTINRNEYMLNTGDTTDVLVREKPRMTWKMLREMSDQGQEITSHGWAHKNVKKINGEELRYEVQHNDTVIWEHTGVFPRTFFYPGNTKSPEKVELGMTHGISRGYDHFKNPQVLWNHFEYISLICVIVYGLVLSMIYRHCYWSYGSGAHSGEGKFELFWPRIYNKNKPGRWAYDAVTYYWLEQSWGSDFYVIKESLGGTAIDPRTSSTNQMYWSASSDYLASTAASDKGGKSLLKAFVDNIGACIDKELAHHKGGYDIKAFIWHQGDMRMCHYHL